MRGVGWLLTGSERNPASEDDKQVSTVKAARESL